MATQQSDEGRSGSTDSFSLYQEAGPLLDVAIAIFSVAQLRHVARTKAHQVISKVLISADTSNKRDGTQETPREILEKVPMMITRTITGDDSETDGEKENTRDHHETVRELLEKVQAMMLKKSAADDKKTPDDDEESLLSFIKEVLISEEPETNDCWSDEDLQTIQRSTAALQIPSTSAALLNAIDTYRDEPMLSLFLGKVGGQELHCNAITSAGVTLVGADENDVNTGPLGTELVYCIFRDDERRRLVVTFRGSITLSDWIHDARVNMVAMPNPGHMEGQETEVCRIHGGFDKYLFQANKNNHGNESKFDQILKKLKLLLLKHAGYSVHLTGHSLGGAASTLFAFKLAYDDEIPKPITVISFGSPKVGDGNFCRAFHSLEQDGKVRHLRIINDDDLVPAIPFATLPSSDGTFLYRDVGITLKQLSRRAFYFWRKVSFSITFPERKEWKSYPKESVVEELYSRMPLKRSPLHHKLSTYHKRFYAIRDELEELELDGLYLDPRYVEPTTHGEDESTLS